MSGHVFVVQGRMEALTTDAVLVTTDADFTLEAHWRPLLGEVDAGSLRPEDWSRGGVPFGRARHRRDLWFLDVTDQSHGTLESLLSALGGALDAIAASGLPTAVGRALPLVAIPVPGIGGGGFRAHTGAVVTRLLETLDGVVHRHDLDVVVVATDAAQYAAIQRERRRLQQWALGAELDEKARGIGEAASSGRLALFLGAGVSVPAGLPSWSDLVTEMRELAVERGADLPADAFARLDVLDQTELLGRVLGDELEKYVAERFSVSRPALAHVLLAALGAREVVTTNYDSCYETAVAARDEAAPITVMPWEKPRVDRPWLLKLHGDAGRPDSVVLTRGQFLGYDRTWQPVGSVFQSLMMTRELLVVGASLSDDNVLRLAHEVRALRQRHDIHGVLGHVLTLGPRPLRARLWEQELEWLPLGGETQQAQARHLEIFLDAVATHASRGEAPYLLDPHYADLLGNGPEAELAARAWRLAQDIERMAEGGGGRGHDPAWQRLADALEALGAGRRAEADGAGRAGVDDGPGGYAGKDTDERSNHGYR